MQPVVMVTLVARGKSSGGTRVYFGIISYFFFHNSILKILTTLLNLFKCI